MSVKLSEIQPIEQWGYDFKRPVIISGPCGVESEYQVRKIATAIKPFGVNILRGGIWKPRTRPDSFQGIGEIGLKWLKEAAFENGLLAAVEVATPRHVEEALKAGVDIFWFGARTTVNPFLVQELADALVGVNIPIFIKNPINPELELWLGAFERLCKSGNSRLAAIHRGFSGYDKSRYRNAPQWSIPIELKRRYPSL